MNTNFAKVRSYVEELGFNISMENENDSILIIEDESAGIKNLVIGCEASILIMEQYLFDMKTPSSDIMGELLKKNRDMVHGAFVLTEDGSKVLFRDTLQLENLDLNEIEASINSLSLLLLEYSSELIKFSQN